MYMAMENEKVKNSRQHSYVRDGLRNRSNQKQQSRHSSFVGENPGKQVSQSPREERVSRQREWSSESHVPER